MKQFVQIHCPSCENDDLVKNGHREHGTQRYRCKHCRRSVQWDYCYKAWEPGIKEHITDQTLNGSGVREIRRHPGMANQTVSSELKKEARQT